MSVAFGTVVAKNYIPFARVLADQLRRFHPNIQCLVALADEVGSTFDPREERFTLVAMEEMGIPEPESFRFRHGHAVLAVAAKPYVLGHILDRGFTSAIFLDPDMFVLDDLDNLVATVAEHAVTLTPHLLEPPAGARRMQRELGVLVSGTFNAGVVGVSERPATRQFLRWWQDRVWARCDHDSAGGVYFDQRWLDLAPSFVEDLHILRDVGVNVAYWNLAERPITTDGDRVSVAGQPCRLLHCSGFDPRQARHLTRHGGKPRLGDLGPGAAVLSRYRALLDAAGISDAGTWPYAFARFTNGVQIPDAARELYRSLGDATRFGDPFDAGRPNGFYAWMNSSATRGDVPQPAVTRLWQALWDQRPDLQHAFPDPAAADHAAFIGWLQASAAAEHGVAPELLPGHGQPMR